MKEASKGRTFAAIEIRQATEGTKIDAQVNASTTVVFTSDDMVKARDRARQYEKDRLAAAELAQAATDPPNETPSA
jgi:hypothetical protein